MTLCSTLDVFWEITTLKLASSCATWRFSIVSPRALVAVAFANSHVYASRTKFPRRMRCCERNSTFWLHCQTQPKLKGCLSHQGPVQKSNLMILPKTCAWKKLLAAPNDMSCGCFASVDHPVHCIHGSRSRLDDCMRNRFPGS